ncbi:hypothetical protein KIN20_014144, partial [Parelaphostrongylus tenuis]
MATLYHEVAYDYEFLIDCHKDVVKSDSFTRKLLEIFEKVIAEGEETFQILHNVDGSDRQLFSIPDAVVLVIVEEENENQIDQRHVESTITLFQPFREWDARLLIERSDAIKSPWTGLQVANTKKTQQVLAEDGVVERFVGNPRDAAAIQATFAGLWAINGSHPVIGKLIKDAIAHPSRHVLKPQLEGGGGNFYGENMAEKLKILTEEERGAFILMERIQPLVAE